MSYASEVKKELTGITVHRDNAKAELMALIRMNGSIGIADHQLVLNVQTEKPSNCTTNLFTVKTILRGRK